MSRTMDDIIRNITHVHSTDEFLATLRNLDLRNPENGGYISYQVGDRTSLFKFQENAGKIDALHYTYLPGRGYPYNIFADTNALVTEIRQSNPNINVTDVSKQAREEAIHAAGGDFQGLTNIDNSLPGVITQLETSARKLLAHRVEKVSAPAASTALLGMFGHSKGTATVKPTSAPVITDPSNQANTEVNKPSQPGSRK